MKTYNKRMILTNGIARIRIADDTSPQVIYLALAQLNDSRNGRNRPIDDGLDLQRTKWIFSRWFNRSYRVKRTYH